MKNTTGQHLGLASRNLENLRKSVLWASSSGGGAAGAGQRRPPTEVLTDRLDEIMILEFEKDGGQQFLNLTVRGLYKHVVASITNNNNSSSNNNKNKVSGHTNHNASLKSNDPTGTNDYRGQVSAPGNTKGSVSPSSPSSSQNRVEETVTDTTHPISWGNTTATTTTTTTEGGYETTTITPIPPPPPPTLKHRKRNTTVSFPPEALQQRSTITYRERLGSYLHPRDMRRLVTPFSTSNEPELMVRRHVMLLNFDPLRAIILRDRLLVIVPNGADSVLVHLENRVRGTYANLEASFFMNEGKNDEDATVTKRGAASAVNNIPTTSGMPIVSTVARVSSQEVRDDNTMIANVTGDDTDDDKNETPAMGRSDYHKTPDTTNQTLIEGDNEEDDDDNTDDDDNNIMSNSEWHDFNRHEWVNLPFELQCVDAVLRVVASILSEDAYELQLGAIDCIDRLVADQGMSDDPTKILRVLRDAATEMRSRVKSFLHSLDRVLAEDEDMALMNLSRLLTHPERFIQPVPAEVLEEESDEPELILEAHLQTAMTLMNSLDLIQGQIETAGAMVDQKLDTTRNRLLYANTVISILTLTVTCAALVGSYFGMNVPNHLEEEPHVFRLIVGFSTAGAIIVAMAVVAVLGYLGAVPGGGSGGSGGCWWWMSCRRGY